MTKTLIPRKSATKIFDYTTIEDRFRTVSLINNSHPTGMEVKIFSIVIQWGIREKEFSQIIGRNFFKCYTLYAALNKSSK